MATAASMNLLSSIWAHMTEVQPVHGDGVYIYDDEDNRFMDFTSGIGVTNTGHCHPRVVAAIQEQAQRLIFGQVNIVIPEPTLRLAAALHELTPPSIDRFFFSNSGAEAVEACVKLARSATGRRNIIVFQGGFHGRTHQTMAMSTARYIHRHNYQPLPGGIFVTPYPYAYLYGWDEETTVEFCLKQLDLMLRAQSAPDETAAILVEPILGEGGYVPAPLGFLERLREICDEHGILLAVDEVQSGAGRSGKFFAWQYDNIEPDIIVMAKGLGSGMPISGIASRAEYMAAWKQGTHGGTYGGGAAVCAAAAAETVAVIQEEGLIDNAAAMGKRLLDGLKHLQDRHSTIGDVRGRGLMVAAEFTKPDGSPDAETADRVLHACLDRNLLLLNCGSYFNVIRFIPPLVVNQEQIDDAVEIFEEALK